VQLDLTHQREAQNCKANKNFNNLLFIDLLGWSHWDQTALGPDNGTSNNKMKVNLGFVWLG